MFTLNHLDLSDFHKTMGRQYFQGIGKLFAYMMGATEKL